MATIIKRPIAFVLFQFYPLFKKWLPNQVYNYLAVGAINTALNIILFAFLCQFCLPKEGIYIGGHLIAGYTVALIIAFVVTVPTGFWLTKNFAFVAANDKKSAKQLAKYLLVVLQGLASDYLILKALIVFVGLNPSVAKILSTSIVLTLNYLLQKYFTFKTRTS